MGEFIPYSRMAPDQIYTKEYLKNLRKQDNVIFDGEGVHAIRIIERKVNAPLLEILTEDDGCLQSCKPPMLFDVYWTDSLIDNLTEARDYAIKNYARKLAKEKKGK